MLENIFQLGIKELWSLVRDRMMLILILYTFTISIYVAATAMPDTLNNASIAIVDQDSSNLSARIISAFYPPHFNTPGLIGIDQMDKGLDLGEFTFVLNIPSNFQRDVLAGHSPAIQLNVDATRMSQAFTGNAYIQEIVNKEVSDFLQTASQSNDSLVGINVQTLFNPNLERSWFGAIMEIINNVTMLSIILTGAALIREREHGTIEHLLVMPVSALEIMLSKVWSMGVVVLVAVFLSLNVIVKGLLQVPIHGSITLFMLVTALHLFATTSIGMFLATIAKSMPQFGMLIVLVLLPLELLSGGTTPRESMPDMVQWVMLGAPTTHFVSAAQAILYKGAGLEVVWGQVSALLSIGTLLFMLSHYRFHSSLASV